MRARGWWFLCVCVREVFGLSRITPLPCPIPSPPCLPAPFLLAHALAVSPLAAALAVLFSVPGWWWRVASSVLLSLHTLLLLRGVSYCVYVFGCTAYLALLAAACVCEYSMGIPFAPYAGVRGWACSLGYIPSVIFVDAVIVVLFPLV